MDSASRDAARLPTGWRWLGVLWLAVYLPSYAWAYGWANFLFLCNLGVILSAIGLISQKRLLISSQAIAAPVIGLAWGLDAGWRLVSGRHLFGGTEYMWDASLPLFTRLLSLYHVVWPLLLLYWLWRLGYDRRAWALQAAIAALAILAARLFTTPQENINFAFRDPFFQRQLGPAAVHLACVWLGLAGIAYGVTHLCLRRGFAPPQGR